MLVLLSNHFEEVVIWDDLIRLDTTINSLFLCELDIVIVIKFVPPKYDKKLGLSI